MIAFNTSEINRLIRERRSVYPVQYTGEIVDEAIINQMLENANWAPTHRFTEPWRFSVFAGEGLQRLAEFQSELYKEKSEAAGTFDQKKYDKLKQKPSMCSHIISIGMARDVDESVPEVEEIAAVAAAIQNMYLTATANGVGCYWGSGGITYMEEAKPFFELGENDQLLGFLHIGTPKELRAGGGKRNPIEEKVRWVRA